MSAVAVIDVGSNTTRLLVRDPAFPLIDVVRLVRITRLGQGLDATGVLSQESMDSTRAAVGEFVAYAREVQAESIYLYATAAARRSSNGQEFIDSLRDEFTISTEIISGEVEGESAFTGAVSGLSDTSQPVVVFDIGGASTEFALSEMTNATACATVKSIPIGSVVMTNRYVESDPPLPEELTNIISEVREYLKEVQREIPSISQSRRWVGVAATVTTVAAIELGLHEFDVSKIHEFELSREAAEDVFRTLATEDLEDRKHNPGLEPERADVIVAGSAIVVAIMRHFDLPSLTVSCADLLDGLWMRSI